MYFTQFDSKYVVRVAAEILRRKEVGTDLRRRPLKNSTSSAIISDQ